MGEPSRPLGLLRVLLGLAQVMGATIALHLLLTTGLTGPTLWATAGTLFFVVPSRLIFAPPDRKG